MLHSWWSDLWYHLQAPEIKITGTEWVFLLEHLRSLTVFFLWQWKKKYQYPPYISTADIEQMITHNSTAFLALMANANIR